MARGRATRQGRQQDHAEGSDWKPDNDGRSRTESNGRFAMTGTTTVAVDAQIGHWRNLSITHKRALAQCRCGAVHQVSVAALEVVLRKVAAVRGRQRRKSRNP